MELAKSDASDHMIRETAGHVSRKMLQQNSQVHLEATRNAFDALSIAPAQNLDSPGEWEGYGTKNQHKIEDRDGGNAAGY